MQLRVAHLALLALAAAQGASAFSFFGWTMGAPSQPERTPAASTGVFLVYTGQDCKGSPDAFSVWPRRAHDPSTRPAVCVASVSELKCVTGEIKYADPSAAAGAPVYASYLDGCVEGELSVSDVLAEVDTAVVSKAVKVQGEDGQSAAIAPSTLYSIRALFQTSPASSSAASRCARNKLLEAEAWAATDACVPLWTLPDARELKVKYWVKNGCADGWRWFKDAECTNEIGGGAYMPFGECAESADGYSMDMCASTSAAPPLDPTLPESVLLARRDTLPRAGRFGRRYATAYASSTWVATSTFHLTKPTGKHTPKFLYDPADM